MSLDTATGQTRASGQPAASYDGVLTFHKSHPDLIAPMAADKSALGTLPLPAFQYCEALRQGSALGWYIFPPRAITLRFDGRFVFAVNDGHLARLEDQFLGEEFTQHWARVAPDQFREQEIPWITSFDNAGLVQIWSGLFVSTAPEWQVLIKPLANIPKRTELIEYEGLVRTDKFKPLPLFYNFNITATHMDIRLDPQYPLFQVVALPSDDLVPAQKAQIIDIDAQTTGAFDWDGLNSTSRTESEDHTVGRYGAEIRRQDR